MGYGFETGLHVGVPWITADHRCRALAADAAHDGGGTCNECGDCGDRGAGGEWGDCLITPDRLQEVISCLGKGALLVQ